MQKPFVPRLVFATLLTVLSLSAASIEAQGLDVPIYEMESDGEGANCAEGTVIGLRADGDSFLAVRTGPGTNFRKIGELRNGDRVRIFQDRDGWHGVLVSGGRIDQSDACGRKGPMRQVSGSGLGWVHGRWIGNIIP